MVCPLATTQAPRPALPHTSQPIFCVLMLARACSMLCDVEHLVDELGKIEGFSGLGTDLINIIESKKGPA